MVQCPNDIVTSTVGCLTNKSWYTNSSNIVSTTLTTTFRHADVSYHRANASIASYTFNIGEEVASVSAQDLHETYVTFSKGAGALAELISDWQSASVSAESNTNSTDSGNESESGVSALDDLLDSLLEGSNGDELSTEVRKRQTDDQTLDLLGSFGMSNEIPGMNPLFPMMPFAMLQSCSFISSDNLRLAAYCTNFLQNFIALPLYCCNALLPARATMGAGLTNPYETTGDTPEAEISREFWKHMGFDDENLDVLLRKMPTSKVAVEKLEYLVKVQGPSLIAYCIIAGLIVALCFGALVMGTMVDVGFGSFALWDFVTSLSIHKDLGEGHYDEHAAIRATLKNKGNTREDVEAAGLRILLIDDQREPETE